MKVVLLTDIKGLGKKFDVKEVNEGYARNFLFPSQKAEVATPKLLEQIANKKTLAVRELKMKDDLLEKSLHDLNGKVINLSGKTNEKKHLFSSIHAKDIRDEIQKVYRISLEEKNVILDKPIKEIGKYEIVIQIGTKKAMLQLNIEESQ